MPAQQNSQVLSIDIEKWGSEWKKAGQAKTKLRQVEEVGFFSRIDGECIPHSRANLHEYIEPPKKTNLNGDDYGDFRTQIERSVGWESLEPYRVCGINVHDYDIVSGRGSLTKIALALYERKYGFEIDAVTLGREEPMFLSTRKQEDVQKHEMEKAHYYARRFEIVCTGQEQVDIDSVFCSLMKRYIGRHEILFTAEIDCILAGHKRPVQSRYAELKCRLKHKKDYYRFMHKYMRDWIQSYLAGVPVIFEGVRNNNGVLLRVDRLKTDSVPTMCKKHREEYNKEVWDETKILDFLEYVLGKVSKVCKKNVGTTIRLKFDPKIRKLTAKLIPGDEYALVMADAVTRVDKSRRRKSKKQSEPREEKAGTCSLWGMFRLCLGLFSVVRIFFLYVVHRGLNGYL